MIKKITILLTCAGGDMAHFLISNIKKSKDFDYRIIGVDSGAFGSSKKVLDCSFLVPKGSDINYINSIVTIVKQEKVDFILPGSDEEALVISKNKKYLEGIGATPLVSNSDILDLITNKEDTYKVLSEKGIATPRCIVLSSAKELNKKLGILDYPNKTVVLKPSNGRGGRDVFVLIGNDSPPLWIGSGKREKRIKQCDFDSLELDIIDSNPFLIMPCLTSPAYDVDVVANNGNVEFIVVRERINPVGVPFEGNKIISSKSKIYEYCCSVVKELKLDSIHDIDLMTDQNGNICLLEVNPRQSGSLAASLVAGYPVIDILVKSKLGLKNKKYSVNKNKKILLENDKLVVH
jgi:carbamoylphosphate synthase large subunit